MKHQQRHSRAGREEIVGKYHERLQASDGVFPLQKKNICDKSRRLDACRLSDLMIK